MSNPIPIAIAIAVAVSHIMSHTTNPTHKSDWNLKTTLPYQRKDTSNIQKMRRNPHKHRHPNARRRRNHWITPSTSVHHQTPPRLLDKR